MTIYIFTYVFSTVCPNFCEAINDPVCGSNGVAYPNVCELGLADCHARSIDPLMGIQFVSFGPCDEGTEGNTVEGIYSIRFKVHI